MELFKLKDITITNLLTSFDAEHYEEGYCDTCGGSWVDDEFYIEIMTNDVLLQSVRFVNNPKLAQKRFLPWVLENQGQLSDLTLDDFVEKLEDDLECDE